MANARGLVARRSWLRLFLVLVLTLLFCCARERSAENPGRTYGAGEPWGSAPTGARAPERWSTWSAYREQGRATYYAARFAGRRTANGERYDPNALTAAHRTLPLGTFVEVRRLDDGRSVVVRVNDRGPYVRGAVIDLSYRAAAQLGILREGTTRVEVRVLPPSRNRVSESTESR